jgi:flagellar hook assembly protein FlgD
LHAAYPNPFNPQTTISFELPDTEYTKIKIYDSGGKCVKTLISGLKEAGRHQVIFDGSNLASGLYFCEMRSGNFQQVQKMLLVK